MRLNELPEVLSNLKKARAILANSYIRFIQHHAGGHCSLGAIGLAKRTGFAFPDDPEAKALSQTATALHPECRGTRAARPDLFGHDHFDMCPIVFVNNHLGKEETLRVWDVTIAELELRLAAMSQPAAALVSDARQEESPSTALVPV